MGVERFATIDAAVLKEAVVFFVVPFGILLLTWAIQAGFQLRLNAGSEFFTILSALDLTYLADQNAGRINPRYSEAYSLLFAVLLMFSLLALVLSIRVQFRIHEHVSGKMNYPVYRVSGCWFLALVFIAFHLYVTLGG